MEPGYEVEPHTISRRPQRGTWLLLAIAAVAVSIVVVKPWAVLSTPSTEARVGPSSHPDASAAVVPSTGPVARPIAAAAPLWPAAATPSITADGTASQAEGALGGLTVHSDRWGVGTAGVGPRMLREEPWTDWAAVAPENVDDLPVHIATWPDTSLCAGYPTLYDNPTVVAVTTPSDLVPDWRLLGWWTDGNRAASLEGSVRQVSPAGNRGVSYLERTDREPWPTGRYEFHVLAGDRTIAMTVCMTRRG